MEAEGAGPGAGSAGGGDRLAGRRATSRGPGAGREAVSHQSYQQPGRERAAGQDGQQVAAGHHLLPLRHDHHLPRQHLVSEWFSQPTSGPPRSCKE